MPKLSAITDIGDPDTPFLTAAQKARLIDNRVPFYIKAVKPNIGQWGDEFRVTASVQGRDFRFSFHKNEARERIFNDMIAYLRGDDAEPIGPMVLVRETAKSGTKYLTLVDAEQAAEAPAPAPAPAMTWPKEPDGAMSPLSLFGPAPAADADEPF